MRFDADVLVRYPFVRGNEITLRLSEQPLNVAARIAS